MTTGSRSTYTADCGNILQPESTAMKPLLAVVLPLIFLTSCVFEAPFDSKSKFPVDPALLGRWEEIKDKADGPPDRMLVLQYAPNEYVVEYPAGEKAMFFRAYAVELEGARYIQIQLLGTADAPAKPEDRKYHLLKVSVNGDALEMRTLASEVLGKVPADSAQLKAAFAAHKDDPKLFDVLAKFRRIK